MLWLGRPYCGTMVWFRPPPLPARISSVWTRLYRARQTLRNILANPIWAISQVLALHIIDPVLFPVFPGLNVLPIEAESCSRCDTAVRELKTCTFVLLKHPVYCPVLTLGHTQPTQYQRIIVTADHLLYLLQAC